ncbi:MAG: hypothetical protein IJO45_05035 [Oscillospiraceae bacterium]|nr:hypothetical protein [Oscillospiraceae bacterium]
MQKCVKDNTRWGKVLWLTTDQVEVGIALDFGIRVVHVSCTGCENLFYVQPADLSDGFTNSDGWKLYGGHRIWMAPESDKSCYPDNEPVTWNETQNGVLITQNVDPLLGIRKTLSIEFLADGGVQLEQSIYNASEMPIDGASWGVNTLDAGGTAYISFTNNDKRGFTPHRVVSLWSDTNLHDPRLSFDKQGLTAKFMPLPDYLKIGLYCMEGKAVFENKGQRFTLCFDAQPLSEYPDNGCNFELYMCSRFMELETLGVKTHIMPGEHTSHMETWYLTKV